MINTTANMTHEELVSMIEQLALECDARHAMEDALIAQVRELGGEPVRYSMLDRPWTDFEEVAL